MGYNSLFPKEKRVAQRPSANSEKAPSYLLHVPLSEELDTGIQLLVSEWIQYSNELEFWVQQLFQVG